MKTFKNCAAQGDLMIRRIQKLPENLNLMSSEKGAYIIAHSETGHHHIIAERPTVRVFESGDPLISYLEVIEATEETETLIEHLRSFDTHESLLVTPGIYEIRRQREYTPEGWRRVAD
ncbi:hypothetical protein [Ferrovum sp.]|uniref:hypothetical protein n=1 Tax=Ferrovum sp. TaxID=2609467 RepID=UPI00262B722F|nr:hypothetical protein [Ferrovum sp.]